MGAVPTHSRPAACKRALSVLASFATAALTTLIWAVTAVAAPTPVGAQTATSNGTSISVATPAGTVAGDVLVGTVTSRVRGGITSSVPSGWTFVRRDTCTSPGTEMTQAVYIRTASAIEPAGTEWTLARHERSSAAVVAYRGVDGGAPLVAHSGELARDTTTATAPSVTTIAPQTLLAGSFGRSDSSSVSAPSGTSQRYTVANGGAVSTFGLDSVRASAGATGSVTTTSTASSGCTIGQLVALKPAPSSDLTPPSVPTSVQVTGATQTSINVAWNASTDNVAVTGYDLYRDGASAGYSSVATASFTGLSCGRSYTLGVEARDAAGNRSSRANVTGATSACTAPPPSGSCTVASTAGCVPGSTITLTDTQWVCNGALSSYGRLPLKVVVNYTPGVRYGGNGAIDLVGGCAGDGNDQTVDLILDVKGDGRTYGPGLDAMKVRTTAGYTAGIQITGRVECGPRYTSTAHQDGVQIQGGRNITFVDFYVGNYDAGLSTCHGAGGAMFYSGAGGYSAQNINVVRGKYIACNHSFYTISGTTGSVTGAMFRSGRTDGTDPVCTEYAGAHPCTGSGNVVAPGVTMSNNTCQRWNRNADRWDNA